MVLDWSLYGFQASVNSSGYQSINYMIEDCEIYSTKTNTPGKIAIYIDRGNHPLTINRVTTQSHLDGGSVSLLEVLEYYMLLALQLDLTPMSIPR
jgi:hypothetical protein